MVLHVSSAMGFSENTSNDSVEKMTRAGLSLYATDDDNVHNDRPEKMQFTWLRITTQEQHQ